MVGDEACSCGSQQHKAAVGTSWRQAGKWACQGVRGRQRGGNGAKWACLVTAWQTSGHGKAVSSWQMAGRGLEASSDCGYSACMVSTK